MRHLILSVLVALLIFVLMGILNHCFGHDIPPVGTEDGYYAYHHGHSGSDSIEYSGHFHDVRLHDVYTHFHDSDGVHEDNLAHYEMWGHEGLFPNGESSSGASSEGTGTFPYVAGWYDLRLEIGCNFVYVPLAIYGMETVGDLYDYLYPYVGDSLWIGSTVGGIWDIYRGDADRGKFPDSYLDVNKGLAIYSDIRITLSLFGEWYDDEPVVMTGRYNLVGFEHLPAGVVIVSDFFDYFGDKLTGIFVNDFGTVRLVSGYGDFGDGFIYGDESFFFLWEDW